MRRELTIIEILHALPTSNESVHGPVMQQRGRRESREEEVYT